MLGEQRILGNDDARDRIDVVREERIETRAHVLRTDATRGADFLCDFDCGRIEQAARVVFHVHHEGVDLGRVGQSHEMFQLVRTERPRVDVDGLDGFGGRRVVE